MTGNLIQHMVEKTYPGREPGFAAAVEIDPDRNLRFQCIAGDFRLRAWENGLTSCLILTQLR
jgi:hypothetical protein